MVPCFLVCKLLKNKPVLVAGGGFEPPTLTPRPSDWWTWSGSNQVPPLLHRSNTEFGLRGADLNHRPLRHGHSDWWPGTESNRRQALKTGKLLNSTWTPKAQNTTKAGLEVHRRYTETLVLCTSFSTRHATRIAEKQKN